MAKDMEQAKGIILSGLKKRGESIRHLIVKRVRENDFEIIKVKKYNQYKLIVTIEVDVE